MRRGEIVIIEEYSSGGKKRYIKAKIVKVYAKEHYNMYLCKNVISGCRVTTTDIDIAKLKRMFNEV